MARLAFRRASVRLGRGGAQADGGFLIGDYGAEAYLKQHNIEPKPFVWTASATDILEKVARGRQVLESLH